MSDIPFSSLRFLNRSLTASGCAKRWGAFVAALVTGSGIGHAQGTVIFNNRLIGTVVAPVTAYSYFPNVQCFVSPPQTNWPSTNGGGSVWCGVYGTNWSVALFAGPPGSTAQQLALVSQTTFRDSTNTAGFWKPPSTFTEVPGIAAGTVGAVFEVRVWYNYSGILTNYADGYCNAPDIALTSRSQPFALPLPLGGNGFEPPGLVGLESFNVGACIECSGAPRVEVFPSTVAVSPGETVTLTSIAWAPGFGPFPFQWRLNGTNIPGSNYKVVLTNIQHTQGGVYTVEAFPSGCAPLVSGPIRVTVLPKFTSVQCQAPGQLRLDYEHSPCDSVAIQFTPTLSQSNWVTLGIASNAQVQASFLDSSITNQQGFYRLQVLP